MRVSRLVHILFSILLLVLIPSVSAVIVWQDDFNYVVPRGSVTDGINNGFVQNGPWDYVKSEENPGDNARGYLYTVDPLISIPGNTINPSLTSSYVLAVEALPGTIGIQTDFYLHRSRGIEGQPGTIDDDNQVMPANVWIQNWIYVARSGTQMTQFSNDGTKWFYPCRDGHGSCHSMSSLLLLKPYAGNPSCSNVDGTLGFYFMDVGENGLNNDVHTFSGACDNPFERGPNDPSTILRFNTWYLSKFHLDTSGPNGVFELWIREYGDPTWIKFADWRSGITPGYTWTVAPENQRGHNFFRIPTTWNTYDAWSYVSDFVVATDEASLPMYNDAGPVLDTTLPILSITSPTAQQSYSTNINTITLNGVASDNIQLSQVTWACISGCSSSGIAIGTTSWSTTAIGLVEGDNVIAVTATDNSSNAATDTLTVTYTAPTGTLLFFDDFEYVVLKNQTDAQTIFLNNGWYGFKDRSNANAWGYIYTTPSIEGYTGDMPGLSSSRVVVLESRAGTEAPILHNGTIRETDFYLQYGDNTQVDGFIPANIWFQFWIYPNDYGTERSQYSGLDKFIYPASSGFPVAPQNISWLDFVGTNSKETDGSPVTVLPSGPNIFQSIESATANFSGATEIGNRGKLGQNLDLTPIQANRWQLVKLHFDLSGPQGVYEVWVREPHTDWVKRTEWIGQVTPQFDWPTTPLMQQGHRTFRMPTTMRSYMIDPIQGGNDSWTYMDDFAISTSEDALPIYPITLSSGPDTTVPTIQITSPTLQATYSTDQATLVISGTAADDVQLSSVSWTCDVCGSGTATGTSTWSFNLITLQEGSNVITVTATDNSSNSAIDTLTVTYTPQVVVPPQPSGDEILPSSIEVDSTYDGYSQTIINRINDGGYDPSNLWLSAYTVPIREHWIIFNFSQSQVINNITIYWGILNEHQYNPANHAFIQYWDGLSFSTVAELSNSAEVPYSTINFTAVNTSRIRILADLGSLYDNWLVGVSEVDLFYNAPPAPVCTPVHEADTTCGLLGEDTCGIGPSELGAYISRFFNGEVTITQLIEVIGLWKNKPGC